MKAHTHNWSKNKLSYTLLYIHQKLYIILHVANKKERLISTMPAALLLLSYDIKLLSHFLLLNASTSKCSHWHEGRSILKSPGITLCLKIKLLLFNTVLNTSLLSLVCLEFLQLFRVSIALIFITISSIFQKQFLLHLFFRKF